MTLTAIIKETPTKELLRALNSVKNYCYFDISVFNVGMAISIKNTDNYKQDSANSWNGYNFCIENDDTTKYYISQELKQRELTKAEQRRFKYVD